MATRLSKEDWVGAALGVLQRDGPDRVAVEPLAKRLGTTKGSFYWHFRDRSELLRAALKRWEHHATDEVIDEIERGGGSPLDRAAALFALVTDHSVNTPGEVRLFAAAAGDDVVREAAERVSARRIDYLARLLREAGTPAGSARHRALMAYTVYLGHALLAHGTPALVPRSPDDRARFVTEMIAMLSD